MGELYNHSCSRCDYSAVVSGGHDWGETIETQTIRCYECCTLQDSAISKSVKHEIHEIEPACAVDAKHRVAPWSSGDPCPKCGAPMDRSAHFASWD